MIGPLLLALPFLHRVPPPHKPPPHAVSAPPVHKHHAPPKHKDNGTFHMWDSAGGNFPPGHPHAIYANGAFAQKPDKHTVLTIDVFGTNPNANTVDQEKGDATPYQAAQWARQRLEKFHDRTAIIYVSLSHWDEVKGYVARMVPKHAQPNVRWWVAQPTGDHDHIVKGADATQWHWDNGNNGVDISTVHNDITKPR